MSRPGRRGSRKQVRRPAIFKTQAFCLRDFTDNCCMIHHLTGDNSPSSSHRAIESVTIAKQSLNSIKNPYLSTDLSADRHSGRYGFFVVTTIYILSIYSQTPPAPTVCQIKKLPRHNFHSWRAQHRHKQRESCRRADRRTRRPNHQQTIFLPMALLP